MNFASAAPGFKWSGPPLLDAVADQPPAARRRQQANVRSVRARRLPRVSQCGLTVGWTVERSSWWRAGRSGRGCAQRTSVAGSGRCARDYSDDGARARDRDDTAQSESVEHELVDRRYPVTSGEDVRDCGGTADRASDRAARLLDNRSQRTAARAATGRDAACGRARIDHGVTRRRAAVYHTVETRAAGADASCARAGRDAAVDGAARDRTRGRAHATRAATARGRAAVRRDARHDPVLIGSGAGDHRRDALSGLAIRFAMRVSWRSSAASCCATRTSGSDGSRRVQMAAEMFRRR